MTTRIAANSACRAAAPTRLAVGYDSVAPFPDSVAQLANGGQAQVAVALTIVLVPFAGLAAALWLAPGRGVGLTDVQSAGFSEHGSSHPARGQQEFGPTGAPSRDAAQHRPAG